MANTPKVWNGSAWVDIDAAASIPVSASTAVVGVVQLEDSTSSTSVVKAATPNSVKTAWDYANLAYLASISREDITVTSAYSQATAFSGQSVRITTNGALNLNINAAVTNGGTRIAGIAEYESTSGITTSNGTVIYWNLGSTATLGTVALSPVVAGSAARRIHGTGFDSNGTAFVVAEWTRATTTGNHTITLRKYNSTFSSNLWNATIVNNQGNASPGFADYDFGPFKPGTAVGVRNPVAGWMKELGAWFGYSAGSLNNSKLGLCRFYIVNDATGSVASVDWSTTGSTNTLRDVMFVPNGGTSTAGTLYADVDKDAIRTWVQCAVSGTSISITSSGTVFPFTDQTPNAMYYDSLREWMVIEGSAGQDEIWSKNFGSKIATLPSVSLSSTDWTNAFDNGLRDFTEKVIIKDPRSGTATSNSTLYPLWSQFSGTYSLPNVALKAGYFLTLAGNGSAEYILSSKVNGNDGSVVTTTLPTFGTINYITDQNRIISATSFTAPSFGTVTATFDQSASIGGVTYLASGGTIAAEYTIDSIGTGTATASSLKFK